MKKIMSLLLTLVICLTSINSVTVNAATNFTHQDEGNNVLFLTKENINYIEGKPGDKHLVYTYESDGSTYKVIEDTNENFDEVNSTIYLENSAGEFIEYATQNLKVNNSVFTLTTNENGVVKTDRQDLSLIDPDTLTKHSSASTNGEKFQTQSLNATCYGYEVGGWGFVSSTQGSTHIQNYTVSSVVVLVTFIATAGAGSGVAAATATIIGNLAAKIVDEQIPILYYNRYYYERKLADPPLELNNFIVATNWYTNFYENSKRTQILYSTDEYSYNACYTS